PLGHTVLGNRNWLRVAGIGMQPSEFAKLALAVFSAYMLEKKQSLLHDYKHIMIRSPSRSGWSSWAWCWSGATWAPAWC
uniref:FtsW/RodA/SpoVE family cell cycle protein n=1 Tax=Arthrobacter sp. JCM 19049 TaxID=1460643 RepID=UPI000A5F0292